MIDKRKFQIVNPEAVNSQIQRLEKRLATLEEERGALLKGLLGHSKKRDPAATGPLGEVLNEIDEIYRELNRIKGIDDKKDNKDQDAQS